MQVWMGVRERCRCHWKAGVLGVSVGAGGGDAGVSGDVVREKPVGQRLCLPWAQGSQWGDVEVEVVAREQ